VPNYELVPAHAIELHADRWPGDQHWRVYDQSSSRMEQVPIAGTSPRRYGSVRVTDGWVADAGSYKGALQQAKDHGPGRYLIAMFTHPDDIPWSTAWRGRVATVVEITDNVLPASVPTALLDTDDE